MNRLFFSNVLINKTFEICMKIDIVNLSAGLSHFHFLAARLKGLRSSTWFGLYTYRSLFFVEKNDFQGPIRCGNHQSIWQKTSEDEAVATTKHRMPRNIIQMPYLIKFPLLFELRSHHPKQCAIIETITILNRQTNQMRLFLSSEALVLQFLAKKIQFLYS